MKVYEIIVFDDGNQKYENLENKWIVIDTMFNGDKVKLKNTIINSISAWKII
jgi:hypothetical protein